MVVWSFGLRPWVRGSGNQGSGGQGPDYPPFQCVYHVAGHQGRRGTRWGHYTPPCVLADDTPTLLPPDPAPPHPGGGHPWEGGRHVGSQDQGPWSGGQGVMDVGSVPWVRQWGAVGGQGSGPRTPTSPARAPGTRAPEGI